MFDPDLFVAWMADQRTGALSALVRDAAWASGSARPAVNRWLGRLQALGVADIDWRTGQWCTKPCVVTGLPGNTQTAVLLGARPVGPDFYRELGAVVALQQPEDSQIPLPSTVWLQYEEQSKLYDFAAAVGAEVTVCAAQTLTTSLAPFVPGLPTAPPARDTPLELLDPATGRFRPAAPASHRSLPGLYRYTLYGRLHRYALLHQPPQQASGHRPRPAFSPERTWHSVDLREGIHHVLPPGAFPMRWKADRAAGPTRRGTLGCLTADSKAPLPLAQERAAVLCTGLVGVRTADAERYDGVPLYIADRIARSLRRRLEIT